MTHLMCMCISDPIFRHVIPLFDPLLRYVSFDFPSLAKPECAVCPTPARACFPRCVPLSLSHPPDSCLLLRKQIELSPTRKAQLRFSSVAFMLPTLIILIGLELSVGNCMKHHDGGMPLVHVLWSITIAMHQILFMSITKTVSVHLCVDYHVDHHVAGSETAL